MKETKKSGLRLRFVAFCWFLKSYPIHPFSSGLKLPIVWLLLIKADRKSLQNATVLSGFCPYVQRDQLGRSSKPFGSLQSGRVIVYKCYVVFSSLWITFEIHLTDLRNLTKHHSLLINDDWLRQGLGNFQANEGHTLNKTSDYRLQRCKSCRPPDVNSAWFKERFRCIINICLVTQSVQNSDFSQLLDLLSKR